MIQPDEYVHFTTADVNLQNQRHYQTYNDFVPAVRDRFPATDDIAVRMEFPDPHGVGSGRGYTNEGAHVLTYRDGKLVRFQGFDDTEAIAAAYRGR